jgi:hypothetical protein
MNDAGSDFIRVGMLGDLPICLADNYSSENSQQGFAAVIAVFH